MTDILFRLIAFSVSAVLSIFTIPRIYFAFRTQTDPLRRGPKSHLVRFSAVFGVPRYHLHRGMMFVGLAIFWIPSMAFAGSNTWTSLGPYGGSVQAIAVDDFDPSIGYIVLRGRLYRSSDGGSNWVSSLTRDLGVVQSVTIDPGSSAVYVGTDGVDPSSTEGRHHLRQDHRHKD